MRRTSIARRALAATLTLILICAAPASEAQQPDAAAGLVGSWTLAAVERGIASGQATRVPGPHGLLVIDSVGHVFEFFGTASREKPESPRLDPQRTFADFGGFWGRYEVAAAGRIDFDAESGVSPNVRGLSFSRSFERDGDRLVMTSTNEPQAQADTRWTWQRAPTVENMGSTYRDVVGLWQHIDERRVNLTTGEVAHNVLAGVQPSAGAILRRFAEVTGDEAVLTIPLGARASGSGAQFVTTVHMHRLSGLDELLPR